MTFEINPIKEMQFNADRYEEIITKQNRQIDILMSCLHYYANPYYWELRVGVDENGEHFSFIAAIIRGRGKEATRENTKEATRENTKEATRENTKEATRENTKEATRENTKEATRENTKED